MPNSNWYAIFFSSTHDLLTMVVVPTRSTSYTHLRDAFMRALQTRLASGMKDGSLTEKVAQEAASPMRKLKSIFPNAPLAKHASFDIFLSAPSSSRPRALVFQDLGSIDWVATEFVLHYFEGDGPSPPVSLLCPQTKLFQ
jgi:hypothetical protein